MWGFRGKPAADGGEAKPRRASPSVVELIRRLLDDGKTLALSEFRLAAAEIQSAARRAVPALILAALALVLLSGAALALLAALIAALAPFVGVAWAALLVALLATAAAAGLLFAARKQIAGVGFLPSRIAKALKDDVEAFKGNEP